MKPNAKPAESAGYTAGTFARPEKECDLVMKGGVTSGVVYPYAVLELAQDYRLRSIGGASAGAIAAAFAAAAEYGRQSGEPEAYLRLEERCLQLPVILEGLFQPSPPFRSLMQAFQNASRGRGWMKAVAFAAPFWPWILGGLISGAALLGGLQTLLGAPLGFALAPGAAVGAVLGVLVVLGWRLWRLLTVTLPKHDFGCCTGMPPGDAPRGGTASPPALTDWIHQSLQYIAFGPRGRTQPLTFGDLAGLNLDEAARRRGERNIDLRMITTNLSMRRPHALPCLGIDLAFEPGAWEKLFPADVMTYLKGDSLRDPERQVAPLDPAGGALRKAPAPDDWPVTVAVRMSLSFPLLISAVPMHARNLAPVAPMAPLGEDERPVAPYEPVLFSDGGISSNFPIHFFDALLPERPTFALSLDAKDPGTGDKPDQRVSMPQTAAAGSFTPIDRITTTGGFASAILGAAKDWQDQMLSIMPGQRERIVHIQLAPNEGGLNLAMPEEVSKHLMAYGRQAGIDMKTKFDFDEHRWRRTLVVYEQLQRHLPHLGATWTNDYRRWFSTYEPKSYRRVTGDDRETIAGHLDALADVAFEPPVTTRGKFPRPTGRLRIVPDV